MDGVRDTNMYLSEMGKKHLVMVSSFIEDMM